MYFSKTLFMYSKRDIQRSAMIRKVVGKTSPGILKLCVGKKSKNNAKRYNNTKNDAAKQHKQIILKRPLVHLLMQPTKVRI